MERTWESITKFTDQKQTEAKTHVKIAIRVGADFI